MLLIDSHCHLNMLQEQTDLTEIVNRATYNEVKYLQTICTCVQDIPIIIDILKKFDNIFGSVGIHPNETTNPKSDKIEYILSTERLIELSMHPKIIGLGETGLDYHYTEDSQENRNKQVKSFVSHIHASQQTFLPIIIHTRDAEYDTTDTISSEMKNHQYSGLIHCFTASKEFAKKMLDLGLYISFSGIITFKNAADLRDIVKFVPLDRILIETDSPYLAPVPMRGKTNEPSFVKYVAETVADIKNITLEEVADTTSKNFFSLFSKATPC